MRDPTNSGRIEGDRTQSTRVASPAHRSGAELPHAVVLTAWNRRGYLAEAIDSVRRCLQPPDELVAVTNYRDDVLERRVTDGGGKWVITTEDSFGTMTSAGVAASTAPVISFLDDDDLYLPERLSVARSAFDADPTLGFLHVGYRPFADGAPVPVPDRLVSPCTLTIPKGVRTRDQFLRIWSTDAAYNGSSITVRRALLAPHVDELRSIELSVPPYLFFRAWVSEWALQAHPAPLVAVRQHSGSSTSGRFEHRSVRLPRLRRISPRLARDAVRIRAFLPAGTWDLGLLEVNAMNTIFASIDDPGIPRTAVVRAALDLAREREVWVPRAALSALAGTRLLSHRISGGMYRFLTTPPTRVR